MMIYVMTIITTLKVLFLLFINNKELIDHPTHYTFYEPIDCSKTEKNLSYFFSISTFCRYTYPIGGLVVFGSLCPSTID